MNREVVVAGLLARMVEMHGAAGGDQHAEVRQLATVAAEWNALRPERSDIELDHRCAEDVAHAASRSSSATSSLENLNWAMASLDSPALAISSEILPASPGARENLSTCNSSTISQGPCVGVSLSQALGAQCQGGMPDHGFPPSHDTCIGQRHRGGPIFLKDLFDLDACRLDDRPPFLDLGFLIAASASGVS